MKIALIGYGRMGREVEKTALKKGHEIISRIDPFVENADEDDINSSNLQDADVCVEFTHPDSVRENIDKVLEAGIPLVVGTTKWFDNLKEVSELVNEKNGTLIYAPNFSLGMNIFFKICETAASVFNLFNEYDVGGFEFHHNGKADSPSGTAQILTDILINRIEKKKKRVYDICDRKIRMDELQFSSLRVGSIPGMHKIIFDSDADTIELTHKARNREGFASGAVAAAEWIVNKKGIYSFREMMNELLKKNH